MNNKLECECKICGAVYYADVARLKHGRQTTCGRFCSYQLRARSKQNGGEHTCAVCGKCFYRSPSQVKAKHGVTACSIECGYKTRKRTVERPYVLTAIYDRTEAAKKAWQTRRQSGKPYPDAARIKARANVIQQFKKLGRVSKFEREAAKMLRGLGFNVGDSCYTRNFNGTFGCVFDLLLPERRLIIECHGNYWHGGRWTWETPLPIQVKNLTYEERKAIFARSIEYDLRILWESEFKKDPVCALLSIVR